MACVARGSAHRHACARDAVREAPPESCPAPGWSRMRSGVADGGSRARWLPRVPGRPRASPRRVDGRGRRDRHRVQTGGEGDRGPFGRGCDRRSPASERNWLRLNGAKTRAVRIIEIFSGVSPGYSSASTRPLLRTVHRTDHGRGSPPWLSSARPGTRSASLDPPGRTRSRATLSCTSPAFIAHR